MAILITGSTRGIGRAIAEALLGAGHDVVLHFRADQENAASVLATLLEQFPDQRITCVQADLSNVAGTMDLAEQMVQMEQPLTGLVLNVGPFAFEGWESHDPQQIRGLFHGNLFAPWTLLQQCAPRLRDSGGVVTVIGQNQIQDLNAAPDWTAYNAAKAGLVVLVRTVAATEGPAGLRINMVNPGMIDTGHYSAQFVERTSRDIPRGRFGTPAEIAVLVQWLHSDAAGYVSGAVIDVNGGYQP